MPTWTTGGLDSSYLRSNLTGVVPAEHSFDSTTLHFLASLIYLEIPCTWKFDSGFFMFGGCLINPLELAEANDSLTFSTLLGLL